MERVLTYSQAIREALIQEMTRDPAVLIMGQGIDDFKGFYGTTLGLQKDFGKDRVFDTPLSEEGMTGVAIGAALGGLRPIHTHIRMDFMLLAMNQIVNIAAKTRYMYGGAVSVPIVIRGVIGRSWGQGAQHSQGLYPMFMHVPGLRVAAPTTPYDAKGCLLTAIRCDDPVVFVEHRMVHFQKGHVPEDSYTVPMGRARVLVPGTDVTLVGVSHSAVECVRAAAALADVGISAEVIDPVWLSPLDAATIAGSVQRTGRLLTVDCAWTACGAGAEIIARVGEELGGRSFRFRRMGFAATVCPTAKSLERLFYPDAAGIAAEAAALVRGPEAPVWRPERIDAPEIVQFKGPF